MNNSNRSLGDIIGYIIIISILTVGLAFVLLGMFMPPFLIRKTIRASDAIFADGGIINGVAHSKWALRLGYLGLLVAWFIISWLFFIWCQHVGNK